MTEDIMDFAKGIDAILIESNYDRRMLVYGDYPEDLKIRIAGDGGHLSNDDCAEAVKFFIDNGTRKFHLGTPVREQQYADEGGADRLRLSCIIEA